MAGYTVSEVARIANITVRTLHHYDAIGLVEPSARSEAGYRLYSDADLDRLQQVLFFKELGFPLDQIGPLLTAPDFDRRAALLMQRELLTRRSQQLRRVLRAVDAALQALEKGSTMSSEEKFEAFADFDPARYEDEVKERWGDTDAYRESKRRTKGYGRKEFEAIKQELHDLHLRAAKLMDAGKKPDSPEAMDVAEAHRAYIEKWFYPCPKSMHRGLGELYVQDSRFTENIDRTKEGLSKFLCEAFRANAAR